MTTKKLLGVLLSVTMAMPASATTIPTGTVTGVVSMAGRGLDGLPLTLVNVETGKSFAVRTAADGSFTAAVPAGSYVFSSPGRGGVSIARAPLSVEVVSGKVASANIEMAALAVQNAAGPAGNAKIIYDAADCITYDTFTLVTATFEPLASVVNGRLYFKSNLSPEYFYTQFEKIQPAVAGGPTHRAFIPKVVKAGGIKTIDYYLQVTSSDFAETKSPEKTVTVVDGAGDCKGKLAPIGNPSGAVSVLSASGSAAGSLAGFGGLAAGAGLGAAAILGIVGGVAAGGAVAGGVFSNNSPTPIPTTPTPLPTPTPAPVPTATPVATCTLTLNTSPNAPGGDWGEAGQKLPNTGSLRDGFADFSATRFYCAAYVTVNGAPVAPSPASGPNTFTMRCDAVVRVFAEASPVSSKIGPAPATWSGDCSGSALSSSTSTTCNFASPSITTSKSVGLTCNR